MPVLNVVSKFQLTMPGDDGTEANKVFDPGMRNFTNEEAAHWYVIANCEAAPAGKKRGPYKKGEDAQGGGTGEDAQGGGTGEDAQGGGTGA